MMRSQNIYFSTVQAANKLWVACWNTGILYNALQISMLNAATRLRLNKCCSVSNLACSMYAWKALQDAHWVLLMFFWVSLALSNQ